MCWYICLIKNIKTQTHGIEVPVDPGRRTPWPGSDLQGGRRTQLRRPHDKDTQFKRDRREVSTNEYQFGREER